MAWGIPPERIIVDPLLVRPEADYYGSCLFQVHLLGSSPGGSTAMVALGGRYDALLRASWTPAAAAAGPPPGAVGASLNVERLVLTLEARRRQQAETASPAAQVRGECVSAGGPG